MSSSNTTYSVKDSAIYKGLSPELAKALETEFMDADMEVVEEGTRIVFEDKAYILKEGVFSEDVPEEKPKKKATAAKKKTEEDKKGSKKSTPKKNEETDNKVEEPKPKKKTTPKKEESVEEAEEKKVEEPKPKKKTTPKKEESVEEVKDKEVEEPKPKKTTTSKKSAEAEDEDEEKKKPARTRASPFTLDDLINAINTNKTAAALKMINRLKDKYGNDIMKMRKPRGKKSAEGDEEVVAPPRKRTAYIEFVASEMPKVTAENIPHAERMAVISARWNALKEKAKKTVVDDPVSEEDEE